MTIETEGESVEKVYNLIGCNKVPLIAQKFIRFFFFWILGAQSSRQRIMKRNNGNAGEESTRPCEILCGKCNHNTRYFLLIFVAKMNATATATQAAIHLRRCQTMCTGIS